MTPNHPAAPDRLPCPRPARAVAGHRRDRPGLVGRRDTRIHCCRAARLASRSRWPAWESACLARRSSCGNVTPRAGARAVRRAACAEFDEPARRRTQWQQPLLQAQIDINAPVDKVWAVDLRFQPDAAMEPAMPIDEGVRPAAPGHPDDQPQPPQLPVLADHVHGHRGHSGEEAGVPGQHQRHHLELRTGADRDRAPG